MKSKILLVLLLVTLLFTSCINIEVHQKLKRSGKYDLSFTISTSEEFAMILDSMEESFVVAEEVEDKYEFVKTDTSISFQFKDLDPETDTKIFEDQESNESDSPDTGILNPENFEFKKETKFPYYVYTYTFRTSPETQEEDNTTQLLDEESQAMLNNLFKMKFSVEVFGSIVEADGDIEGNTVSYDIAMDSAESHTIVFKDFFLMAWLGSKYGFLFIIGIVVFLSLLILPYFLMKKKKIAVDPKISEYVQLTRNKQVPDSKIKEVLLQGGWSEDQVDKALKQKPSQELSFKNQESTNVPSQVEGQDLNK